VFRKGLLLVRNGILLEHLSASIQRILAGFIAGLACWAIPIGLAMGSFRARAKAAGTVHGISFASYRRWR